MAQKEWRLLMVFMCVTLVMLHAGLVTASSLTANGRVSVEGMRADLEYLQQRVEEIHPGPYHSIPKTEYEKLWQKLYQRIQTPITYGEFYFTLLEALYPLHDGHSSVYYAGTDVQLPVEFVWLEDGLFVHKGSREIQRGDQVLAIGGKRVDEIFTILQGMIPAENPYWVKTRGEKELRQRLWLDHLGLVGNDQVIVTVQDALGNVSEHALSFVEPSQPKFEPYSYTIMPEANLAIFYLNICEYDNGYKMLLQEFFSAVRSAGITRVAVDVRKNTGGYSAVIDEFLSYTTVKKYNAVSGKIHYSKWAVKENGLIAVIASHLSNTYKVKVQSKEVDLYAGELYVLTAKATFSSANWFAIIFQDNGIGTVVGEPTGNAPSSYGYPLGFNLPNSGFRCNVSHVQWTRPDQSRSADDALYPDVHLPQTPEDLRLDRDLVIQWLIEQKH